MKNQKINDAERIKLKRASLLHLIDLLRASGFKYLDDAAKDYRERHEVKLK